MTIIRSPNYTQVPNDIFSLLPQMKEAELKVTMVIIRATFGWQQGGNAALISITDMMERAGLSRQGVLNGLADGMERGLLYHQKGAGGRKSAYGLVVHEVDTPEILTENHQGSSVYVVDRGSQRSRPSSVYLVDRANGSQAAPSAGKPSAERKIKESNKEKQIPTPVGVGARGGENGSNPNSADGQEGAVLDNSSASAKTKVAGKADKVNVEAGPSPSSAAPLPKSRPRDPIFDALAPHVVGSSDSEAITASAAYIRKIQTFLVGKGIKTPEEITAAADFIQTRVFPERRDVINQGSWEKHIGRYISVRNGSSAMPPVQAERKFGAGKNEKVVEQLKAARTGQVDAQISSDESKAVIVVGDDGVLKW